MLLYILEHNRDMLDSILQASDNGDADDREPQCSRMYRCTSPSSDSERTIYISSL